MTLSTILILILASLLVASWVLFANFNLKRQQHESLLTKKADQFRRAAMQEAQGLDAVLGTLEEVHRLALDSMNAGTRGAMASVVLETACQLAQCSMGSLMMLDKDKDELQVLASKGLPENAMRVRLRVGEGVAGRAAASGKMVLVDNIETDARFLKDPAAQHSAKSMLSVPLKVRNRVVGVINAEYADPHHAFDDRSMKLLQLLADQSALMFENVDLYQNLHVFYLEVVETLSRALEFKENVARDPLDYRRLRVYARSIAEHLSLPESIVKHIEFASIVYGIGKIGIDDTILRKPGKLTDQEFEQIKKHPEIGHKMISRIKFLLPVTPMILYHQERWDGKGYPAGLRGEEIPLGSRIVAVVNAYNAMITDRPYRKALPTAEAIEELKRGAGSQFDPKVVDAFIQVLRKEDHGPNGKNDFEQTNGGELGGHAGAA